MIRAVRANDSRFRQVDLEPGFNIILAERHVLASSKDSRNGVGKSTLIEIIHFCLGARVTKNRGLLIPDLEDWSFAIDLEDRGASVTIERSVRKPQVLRLTGQLDDWSFGALSGADISLKARDFNEHFGRIFFGLAPRLDLSKFSPSFRSLIPYFARRERSAFSTPFEHFRKQLKWDKQVNSAYLLGLAWEHSSRWESLREQSKVLETLRKAAREGLVDGFIGTRGHLEAERSRLDEEARAQAERLASFLVHPDYRGIEEEANNITKALHDDTNANVSARRLVDVYREGLHETHDVDPEIVQDMYSEAGADFPDAVTQRLEDVRKFHDRLIANRRDFLVTEIGRIERDIATRDDRIRDQSGKRAQLLRILSQHGALDEHAALQHRQTELVAQVADLDRRIDALKRFEEGRIELKIQITELYQESVRDYEERREKWNPAVRMFNSNSEALYETPGRLVIEIDDRKGLELDVEIQRSGSTGIDSMKVFCYDLMLAQLWSSHPESPGFLIHDSALFDGVDERQVARALALASERASQSGFQYICTMNSDVVPYEEFPAGFDLGSHVRLKLTDATPEGSLLGFRF